MTEEAEEKEYVDEVKVKSQKKVEEVEDKRSSLALHD